MDLPGALVPAHRTYVRESSQNSTRSCHNSKNIQGFLKQRKNTYNVRESFAITSTLKGHLTKFLHEKLWHLRWKFNIIDSLVQIIKALYKSSRSTVVFNNQVRDIFSDNSGCSLKMCPINIFLNNMQETLHNYHTYIFTGVSSMCTL